MSANNAKIGRIIAINDDPENFAHKDKVYKVIKNFKKIDKSILN